MFQDLLCPFLVGGYIPAKISRHEQVAPVHAGFINGIEQFCYITATQLENGETDPFHLMLVVIRIKGDVVSAFLFQPMQGFLHVCCREK